MTKINKLVLNSKKLKQLRQQQGLSQEALVEACEQQYIRVSISTIKRAETSRPISIRTANNIARFYNVEVKELCIEKEHYGDVQVPAQDNRNKLFLLVATLTSDRSLNQFLTSKFKKLTDHSYSEHYPISIYVIEVDAKATHGTDNIIYKIRDIFFAARQFTTLIHPFTCYATTLQADNNEAALEAGKAQLANVSQLINFIPTNRLIVSESIKLLFDRYFCFNTINVQSHYTLWSLDDEFHFDKQPYVEIIGRDKELASLKQVIDQTFDSGDPSLTVLHGDSGIGKSRILQEIGRYYFHQGASVSYFDIYRKNIDWWSLAEIALNFSQQSKGSRVLVIIDNIDDCDDELLQRLRKVQRSITTGALAIIVAAESKNISRIESKVIIDYCLSAAPLDKASCYQDLTKKLRLSPQVAKNILDSSGCIPLYLRMMLSPQSKDVEESLRLLVQSKLSSLEHNQVTFILGLALYGKPINLCDIKTVCNEEINLDVLASLGLIRYLDDQKLTIANKFIKHAIIELTDRDRMNKSHRLAAKITTLDSGSLTLKDWQSAQHHYSCANCPAKVAWCSSHIAHHYLEQNLHEEAEKSIIYGLNTLKPCTQDLSNEVDVHYTSNIEIELKLLLVKLYTLKFGWGYSKVESLYLDILQQCELVSATSRHIETLFGLWAYNISNSQITNAYCYVQKIQQLASQFDNSYYQAMIFTSLANTKLWLGEHQEAIDYANQALSLFAQDDLESYQVFHDQDPRMLPYHILVISKTMMEHQDSHSVLEEMLLTADSLESCFNRAIAYQSATLHYWQRRDPVNARDYALKLYQLSHEKNYYYYRGLARLIIGWADDLTTHDPKCLTSIVHAYEVLMTNAGGELSYSVYAVVLGEALLRHQQTDTAAKFTETAVSKCLNHHTDCYLPELLALRAISHDHPEQIQVALNHPLCTPRQRTIIADYLESSLEMTA